MKLLADRIPKGFNIFGTTRAAAVVISRASDSAWQAALVHKLESNGKLVRLTAVILIFQL